jgi:transcriptional repressor p66
MDVDENIVDLSLGSGRDFLTITPTSSSVRDLRALPQTSCLTITPTQAPLTSVDHFTLHATVPISQSSGTSSQPPNTKRVLRPRTEPRSYAETPDIILLPAKINGRQVNGTVDSDSDDGAMPPLPPVKVTMITLNETFKNRPNFVFVSDRNSPLQKFGKRNVHSED